MNEKTRKCRTGVYPASFEAKIGFDAVRRMVADRCLTPAARALADAMEMSTDFDTVRTLLSQVSEMMAVNATGHALQLGSVADPAGWLAPARVPGSFIDVRELGLLRMSLATAASVKLFFDKSTADGGATPYPALSEIVSRMDAAPPVTRAIDAVLDRNGVVKDNASPQLADIRRQLSQIGGRISSALRRVMAAGIRDGILDADTTPAMRDGRLVIPVPPMYKRQVQGIVHDESATGKTVYIEPAEVVELNNRQRELEIDERHEIVRILTAVTDTIRPEIDGLLETFAILAQLDFINAKAVFAADTRAEMPRLQRKPVFDWFTARHPVLQMTLESQGRQIVPLTMDLHAPDRRILIISGPNAGGKSVALKTVGTVQYMMQCGLMPTLASNSTMGMVNAVFADIGDEQSIEDDLSTYSSHLRNMRHFLTCGDNHTLILIDEFGTGTEPRIGGAIAQALLTRFNDAGMWGVITTHYQNLKTLAEDTPGLVNGSMAYDRGRMQPLFSLAMGHPGSSFAIEIARKTGLPADVVADAERIAGSDYVNLDKYLLDIARDKRYWADKRQQVRQREKHLEQVIERYETDADTLRASRRAIIDDARRQAEEILTQSNATIERTIHDIRKSQAERQATLEARERLAETRRQLAQATESNADTDAPAVLRKAPKAKKRKNTATPRAQQPATIAVGDNVLLDNAGQPGSVLEIDGKKAVVAFGALKMTVDTGRLTPTLRKVQTGAKAASFVSSQTTDAMRDRQLNFKGEIDVRGMRADEAIQAVTYFIDDALQFNIGRVRILHGTGTGALRQAIRQYLGTVTGVHTYHDEDVRFGGAGITVVEM